jgi:drug/metabolite transporter (DMT)-like permease
MLFLVRALRELGAARTGAYFSIAPFVGAGLSILLLHEPVSLTFWIAGGCMALGVWLTA